MQSAKSALEESILDVLAHQQTPLESVLSQYSPEWRREAVHNPSEEEFGVADATSASAGAVAAVEKFRDAFLSAFFPSAASGKADHDSYTHITDNDTDVSMDAGQQQQQHEGWSGGEHDENLAFPKSSMGDEDLSSSPAEQVISAANKPNDPSADLNASQEL